MTKRTVSRTRPVWGRRTAGLRTLLLEVSLRVLQQQELEQILRFVCQELCRIMQAQQAVVQLHGPHGAVEFAAADTLDCSVGTLVLPISDGADVQGTLSIQPVHGAGFTAAAADDLSQFAGELARVLAAARGQERLRHLAHHDPLTGLPNRRMFEDALRQLTSGALLLIDVDAFKQVNDTMGHPAGDQLLVELATRMKRVLRQGDMLARLGGDEFALVAAGISLSDAFLVAERLRREVAAIRLEAGGRILFPTISIGVMPLDGICDWKAAVHGADFALYQAKQRGKNCAAAGSGADRPLPPEVAASAWAPSELDEQPFGLRFACAAPARLLER